MLVVVAVPVPAATMSVPPLLKVSGATQQTDAPTVVPVFSVIVPRLLSVVVPNSSSSPVPARLVTPCRVSAVGVLVGEVSSLAVVPLIVVVMEIGRAHV